jgi:hypothetical protein
MEWRCVIANNPTVGVYIPGTYINSSASPYPNGAGDLYGNQYPTGLNVGKMVEIGDGLAAQSSNPAYATQLFGGAYQWIQIDSGATQAYIAPGRAAFMKLNPAGVGAGVEPQNGFPNMLVTSQDQADSINLRAGVFIDPTAVPGNYAFIFVGAGRVEVTYRSALTNGAPAIGDAIAAFAGGNGLFDDISATTTNALTFGFATTTPAANGTSAMYIRDIIYRIPGV